MDLIGLEEIRAAAEVVTPVLRPTPVRRAHALSRVCGREVLLKPEHLQRTGSFKIRGAYHRLAGLPARPPEGRDDLPDVVAASAGNHAQGVALAATITGHRALVFMPSTVTLPKLAATRDYGAEVRLVGATVDDAVRAARAHAESTGAVFVPPFDDATVLAGQGTLGLELATEAPQAQVVVVPVGGGGLIGGVATALAHVRPQVRVIGVQAAAVPSMVVSLAAGRPVEVAAHRTLADGIAVRSPSALTLAHVQAHVHEVVTVTEEELARAVLLLLERARSVVEPAGAAGLAALLAGKVPGDGPVLAVLSGGNVDAPVLTEVIDFGLSAAGRYLVLRLVLADRPGALADATRAIADLGLNVLAVEHHRLGVALGVDEVEVVVTLETRGPEHRAEVLGALGRAGLRVELVR
ncbi:MAG: threonine ammonia-lyase [Acidimicrobiales bacterium]|nr:threonine ammonia-lyase [Acidimicrobiales bacterium]